MGFKLTPAEFVVSGHLLGSYTLSGTLMQSPNYVPGVSGWAIFGNGSAEFNNGTFRGLVAAAAVLLQGSSGQVLVYSGAPAAGNLIASISGAAGTDSKGNPFPLGLMSEGTGANPPQVILSAGAVTATPGGVAAGSFATLSANQTPSAGIVGWHALEPVYVDGELGLKNMAAPAAASGYPLLFSDGGFAAFVPDSASGDTSEYHLGHLTTFATTDQPITLTSFSSTCGTAPTVGAGKYRVRAVLTSQQGPNAAANNYRLGFTGTISQVRVSARHTQLAATGESVFGSSTTSNNGLLATPAFAATAIYVSEFDGIIVTTSTGQLSIQAAMSAATDTFTVLALSFFHLQRIG